MEPTRFDALTRTLATAAASRRTALTALLAGIIAPWLLAGDGDAKRGKGRNSNRGKGGGKGNSRGNRQARRPDNRDRGRGARVRAEAACFTGSPCTPGPGKNLGRCDFGGSSALKGKNLTGANLGGANLAKADASGANLSGANLDRACLVDANLTGAKVNGSTNIASAILCRTTMPDRSTSDAGCNKGTSCCPTCDTAHPCPNGQVCCAGKCVIGACCNANDCETRTCQNTACVGRQCVYTTVSGTPGPNCNTLCCDGTCGSTSALCGGMCGNVCTSQETCCGDKCVPTRGLCGGICDNICQADEACCGEKCTPTKLLCGGNCQNTCPDTLACCGSGVCQECCGSDTSTCKPARTCEQVTCENGVCTPGPVEDGTPCEAGKGTCCGGRCIPTETLCSGICGNVCAAPTPHCCGQTCQECCTDMQCPNPTAPFCLSFQCVDEEVVRTFERVRDIVAEDLGVDEDKITMDSRFIEDLGADSLDAVELILEMEEEFGLEISDEDAEKIRTVGDAVRYVVAHVE